MFGAFTRARWTALLRGDRRLELELAASLLRERSLQDRDPFLDERGRSARVLVELVASLFGRRILDRPTLPIEAVPAEPAGRA